MKRPLYSQLSQIEKQYPDKLLLKEIFASIQGEGILTGLRTLFIRFAGCNLACPDCDTIYDCDRQLTQAEVINEVKQLLINQEIKYVSFTGGEPLINKKRIKQIINVIDELTIYDKKLMFTVESNGLVPLTKQEQKRFDLVNISPKFPSYGQTYKISSCAQFVSNDFTKVQFKFVVENIDGMKEIHEFLNLLEKELGDEAYKLKSVHMIFQPWWTTTVKQSVKVRRQLKWDEQVQLTFDKLLIAKEYIEENNLFNKYPYIRLMLQTHSYLELR